jgi:hypothetical protein
MSTAGLRGQLDGRPFVAEQAVVWKDPDRCWLTIRASGTADKLPPDPLQAQPQANSFEVLLDPRRLRPGSWTLHDRAPILAGCPVLGCQYLLLCQAPGTPGASQQTVMRCQRAGWTLTLHIDSVTCRGVPDTELVGVGLRGSLQLRFEADRAWLEGPFAARDVLREEEHPVVLPAPAEAHPH